MSSSERTLPEPALPDPGVSLPSDGWSRTWPRSGTASSGTLSEHPTAGPLIAGSVSSFWPSGLLLPTLSASSATGPGLPRTAQIRLLGNGVVPLQGRLAVHSLTGRALEMVA